MEHEEPVTTTIAETENYLAWRADEPDGESTYHLELNNVTLHFFKEEWQEFLKLAEIVVDEAACDLERTVAAEIEQHHRVAVFNGADRPPMAVVLKLGNDKLGQVLVDGAGVAGAQAIHRRSGICKLWALAQHMGFPALLDHRPIRVVTVHGDGLAATA